MILMVHWNQMKIKKEIKVSWVTLSEYGTILGLGLGLGLGLVGLVFGVRDVKVAKLISYYEKEENIHYFVPGLLNLGNNCFLNVVLQSLASCSTFRCFLHHVSELQPPHSPLLSSLSLLLQELSTFQQNTRTLNPHKVMAAMQQYVPHFQLSNQQDAAESFLHLLSCLRDELLQSYMPNFGSLVDVAAPTTRILASDRIHNIKELQRWKKQYLGPFDGILASFLTCRTCSSEIMMDFDFFHTLSLSPISNLGASIMHRFTLEDHIKRFLAPELIENYCCSHCWHIAAIKFLSSFGEHQDDISKLSCCSDQDPCNCRKLSSLQTLPWINHFSCVFKQLSIVHCPQILCLHLQRNSLNSFGELVKIQGHVYFPLILNLSPFAKYEIGIQNMETNKTESVIEKPRLASTTYLRNINKVSDPMIIETSQCCPPLFGIYSSSKAMHTLEIIDDPAVPKNILYRLVSVVEHFGRAGSGHYTVYRGVTTQKEDAKEPKTNLQWFRISDSEVHDASEKDVLGAEATLLFYEKI